MGVLWGCVRGYGVLWEGCGCGVEVYMGKGGGRGGGCLQILKRDCKTKVFWLTTHIHTLFLVSRLFYVQYSNIIKIGITGFPFRTEMKNKVLC